MSDEQQNEVDLGILSLVDRLTQERNHWHQRATEEAFGRAEAERRIAAGAEQEYGLADALRAAGCEADTLLEGVQRLTTERETAEESAKASAESGLEWARRAKQAEAENARLKAAATALYMAGCWMRAGHHNAAEDARLWEALRDALGLPPGTATIAGVGQQALKGGA